MNFADVDGNDGDNNNNGTGDDNIQNGIDTVKEQLNLAQTDI